LRDDENIEDTKFHENLILSSFMSRLETFRICPYMRAANILWVLLLNELRDGYEDAGKKICSQPGLSSYAEREFGNRNLGIGGLAPGGCGSLQYGVADHNNSLERTINQGLKKFTRRARPTIAVALAHLRDFTIDQCKNDSVKQFAFDVDYFGKGTQYYSARHFDTFEKGRILVEDEELRRLFLKKPSHEEWFFPSSGAMKEIEKLVKEKVIAPTTQSKLKRLYQWLSTYRDFLSVESPIEVGASFSEFAWWIGCFYRLVPCQPIPSQYRSETWRKSPTTPKEQEHQYWRFHCTCPHGMKYNFCKHGFALSLHLKHFSMPHSRSNERLGLPRKRGRPSQARVSHW